MTPIDHRPEPTWDDAMRGDAPSLVDDTTPRRSPKGAALLALLAVAEGKITLEGEDADALVELGAERGGMTYLSIQLHRHELDALLGRERTTGADAYEVVAEHFGDLLAGPMPRSEVRWRDKVYADRGDEVHAVADLELGDPALAHRAAADTSITDELLVAYDLIKQERHDEAKAIAAGAIARTPHFAAYADQPDVIAGAVDVWITSVEKWRHAVGPLRSLASYVIEADDGNEIDVPF